MEVLRPSHAMCCRSRSRPVCYSSVGYRSTVHVETTLLISLRFMDCDYNSYMHINQSTCDLPPLEEDTWRYTSQFDPYITANKKPIRGKDRHGMEELVINPSIHSFIHLLVYVVQHPGVEDSNRAQPSSSFIHGLARCPYDLLVILFCDLPTGTIRISRARLVRIRYCRER